MFEQMDAFYLFLAIVDLDHASIGDTTSRGAEILCHHTFSCVSCVTRHARAYLKIPLIIYASNSWTQIHRGPHLRGKKW